MRRSGILIFALFLCGCGGVFYNEGDFGGTGGDWPTYSLSPNGNYANDSYEVTLSYSRDPYAAIFYTTDGWDPRDPSAHRYTTPFTVSNMTTLRAMASNNGVWSEMLDNTIYTGTGTPMNPYSITTAQHLHNVRNKPGSCFRQDEDINLAAYSSWTPLGNAGTPFTGTYDGNGHVIQSMTISPAFAENGLFGYCAGATLRRITMNGASAYINAAGSNKVGLLAGFFSSTGSGRIESCTVSGSIGTMVGMMINNIGGLVGEVSGPANISNCNATVQITVSLGTGVGGLIGALTGSGALVADCRAEGGDISGQNSVGGLVGEIGNALVVRCFAIKTVTGTINTGGLVGSMGSGSKISDCYSQGSITGTKPTGGLIGLVTSTSIERCFALGNVNGTEDVGGLVGTGQGVVYIQNSFARGPVVSSGNAAGGFIGYMINGTISNCYATGSVTGPDIANNYAGGFVGSFKGIISRSYSVGKVTGHSGSIGGFLGTTTLPTNESCYWDTDRSEVANAAYWGGVSGITGLQTTQMKQQTSFSGWDFATIWTISGSSYPYFRWQGGVNIPE